MAKYVVLYNFTDQGIQNVKESPERARAAVEQSESLGMNVLGIYYTQGPYDLVGIVEGDEETAAAFNLAIGAQGNARSLTMRAWDIDEFDDILGKMP